MPPTPSHTTRLASRNLLLRLLSSPRLPAMLLAALGCWFVVWAIEPRFPEDFLIEHILTVAVLVFLLWSRGLRLFSNLSYLLLFAFLCLHVVGAHYTYSEVPYEQWFARGAAFFGIQDYSFQGSWGFRRNHFDRLVHFSFGLLCAYPIRELFVRLVRVRGVWGYLLPLDVTLSLSALYELMEWGVAMIVAADVGQSYLGTQGDEWDAQKDMALAAFGALVAMSTTALVNHRLQRDFSQELADSMRPPESPPLGEVRLAAMVEERQAKQR